MGFFYTIVIRVNGVIVEQKTTFSGSSSTMLQKGYVFRPDVSCEYRFSGQQESDRRFDIVKKTEEGKY